MTGRAVLWGEDATMLGARTVAELTPALALALTRGAVAKRYSHLDPNEDAVAAVVGERATLLLCADGHNGFTAPFEAVHATLAQLGGDPPPADLGVEGLAGVMARVNEAIVAAVGQAPKEHRDSRTTLTFALLAGTRAEWASFGDSAVMHASQGEVQRVDTPGRRFLGNAMTPAAVAGMGSYGSLELQPGDALVLATDGVVDFAPRAALSEALASPADAKSAVEAVVAAAERGGAGDNVAAAVALIA